MNDPEKLDPAKAGQDAEFNRRRQQRSLVTAVLLVGMCLLFYFITLVRIGQ